MKSIKFKLNAEEKSKIFSNAKLFAIPAIIFFLEEYVRTSDLQRSLIALKLYALNVVIDAGKKYLAGK